METHTRWCWKSKAHTSGNHGFVFSDFIGASEAKSLIRQYWNLTRLPTGFTLFYSEAAYEVRPEDIQNIGGKTIMPTKS